MSKGKVSESAEDCNTFYMLVGRKICSMRCKYGISEDDFASAAGISKKTLGKIESGEMPVTVLQLIKMAGHLNLPIEDLLPDRKVNAFAKMVAFSSKERKTVRTKLEKTINRVADKKFTDNMKLALDAVAKA